MVLAFFCRGDVPSQLRWTPAIEHQLENGILVVTSSCVCASDRYNYRINFKFNSIARPGAGMHNSSC